MNCRLGQISEGWVFSLACRLSDHGRLPAGHRAGHDSDSPFMAGYRIPFPLLVLGGPSLARFFPPNRLVSPRSRAGTWMMATPRICAIGRCGVLSEPIPATTIASHCPAGSGPGGVPALGGFGQAERTPTATALPLRRVRTPLL